MILVACVYSDSLKEIEKKSERDRERERKRKRCREKLRETHRTQFTLLVMRMLFERFLSFCLINFFLYRLLLHEALNIESLRKKKKTNDGNFTS